jgi:hypothetical protein
MGGSDDPSNIVRLTVEEHVINYISQPSGPEQARVCADTV